MPKITPERTEVGGVFRPGTPCPGQSGPYPGPWFTLSVHGALYRGRYAEPGVWLTQSGTRFSQLPRDSDTVRSSPAYAALRLSLIHELMASERAYSPQEIAVAVRNHDETDPREIEMLETSQDWPEAHRRAKEVRW